MSTPFSKSLTAINSHSDKRLVIWLILAVALLGLWFTWFFSVPVALYSSSMQARLEVHSDIVPIHVFTAGRVRTIHANLGKNVQQGQLLVELDTHALDIELEEAQQRFNAVNTQAQAITRHIEIISTGIEKEAQELTAQLATANAKFRGASLEEESAGDQLARIQSLHKKSTVSDSTLTNARNKFEQASAVKAAAQSSISEIQNAGATRKTDRQARINELQTDLAALNKEQVTLTAAIKRLEYEISEHRIVAPMDGKIGELVDLYAGMRLNEGDRIGVFVPGGDLQVEAFFKPADALGRIKPGHQASLFFEGFPWTQYGNARATVTQIAEELSNGLIKVKLSVRLPSGSAIPLQHGMPVRAEVHIEDVLPAELVLRAAGKMVHSQ